MFDLLSPQPLSNLPSRTCQLLWTPLTPRITVTWIQSWASFTVYWEGINETQSRRRVVDVFVPVVLIKLSYMSYSQKCLQGARRGRGASELRKNINQRNCGFIGVCVFSKRGQRQSEVFQCDPLLWWAANLNIKVLITHIQRQKERERERGIQMRVFSNFPEALRGSWPDEVFKLQVLWHSGYFVLITLALPLCFWIYFNFNLYSSRSLHSDFQHPVISLLKCQDLSAQRCEKKAWWWLTDSHICTWTFMLTLWLNDPVTHSVIYIQCLSHTHSHTLMRPIWREAGLWCSEPLRESALFSPFFSSQHSMNLCVQALWRHLRHVARPQQASLAEFL